MTPNDELVGGILVLLYPAFVSMRLSFLGRESGVHYMAKGRLASSGVLWLQTYRPGLISTQLSCQLEEPSVSTSYFELLFDVDS
jgi:hypothetical protein